ncbi:hypothetical protein, partial [Streptomyces nigra]|uniref:hypothetical protein n=1 Tax=Streptomyces nigra TaxID=1827580 RepID=UPI0037F4D9ED
TSTETTPTTSSTETTPTSTSTETTPTTSSTETTVVVVLVLAAGQHVSVQRGDHGAVVMALGSCAA